MSFFNRTPLSNEAKTIVINVYGKVKSVIVMKVHFKIVAHVS